MKPAQNKLQIFPLIKSSGVKPHTETIATQQTEQHAETQCYRYTKRDRGRREKRSGFSLHICETDICLPQGL